MNRKTRRARRFATLNLFQGGLDAAAFFWEEGEDEEGNQTFDWPKPVSKLAKALVAAMVSGNRKSRKFLARNYYGLN